MKARVQSWFLFLRLPLLALLLSACAAPVLMMSPQGQVMWALLKPLVGLDPNTVNLWEQPMFKSRMSFLLGDRYEPAMRLLRTANQLQQEGPLFFIVSRSPIPEIAEGAGLVWNADTNQMAAMLAKGEVAEVFAEYVKETVVATGTEAAAAATAKVLPPTWPAAMQPWLAAAAEVKQMSDPAMPR
ncbi:MAG: hypothetical protein FJ164_13190 [Gammaproteobacteria bacterium]|nr:hypothetical protein [Gammaproteobacteria bacterium]